MAMNRTETEALVLAQPHEPVSMDLFNLLREQAAMLIKTGFLPAHLRTPEQAVAVVLIGRELHVPMMQALRKVFVIEGTPALASELMLALAERTGQMEDLRIEDDGATATVTVKRQGRKSPVTTSFSMKDAEAMALSGKNNWKKQPATMRRWRAIAANLRLTFPDAIGGMYSVEEVAPEIVVDATGTPLALPSARLPEEEPVNPLLPRRVGEAGPVAPAVHPEAQPEPVPDVTWDEIMGAMVGQEEEHGKSAERVEQAQAVPARTRFEINGKEVVTAGITKDPLLKAYKLGALVDELEGKGKAKDLLGREFGLEHRTELTEAQGKKYVAALAALINKHGGRNG